MNELQDKLMTVRLREAQAQAELREVKLKALQLESQVLTYTDICCKSQCCLICFMHFSRALLIKLIPVVSG